MIQGLNTHGIKNASLSLAYMYRMFVRDYKVYLFDRRPIVDSTITIKDMANDLAEIMYALNIKDAYILGVSQGGMIAQQLAIDHPALVNKLVLAVTLSRNNDVVENVINHWINLTKQGKMKELIEDMAIKMYSKQYIKRYKPFLPLLTYIQKPKDVERFINLSRSCLTCQTYQDLNKIKCPVFVIGGKLDQVVGESSSIELAQQLNCDLYMYEHLGHACYGEAKDFNQKVKDFFDQ